MNWTLILVALIIALTIFAIVLASILIDHQQWRIAEENRHQEELAKLTRGKQGEGTLTPMPPHSDTIQPLDARDYGQLYAQELRPPFQ